MGIAARITLPAIPSTARGGARDLPCELVPWAAMELHDTDPLRGPTPRTASPIERLLALLALIALLASAALGSWRILGGSAQAARVIEPNPAAEVELQLP